MTAWTTFVVGAAVKIIFSSFALFRVFSGSSLVNNEIGANGNESEEIRRRTEAAERL